MSNSTEPREAARQRAQNYFTQTEKRDALVREEIEKERSASANKTAKLRALRLAKEAAEKAETDRRSAAGEGVSKVGAKKPVRRRRAVKAAVKA